MKIFRFSAFLTAFILILYGFALGNTGSKGQTIDEQPGTHMSLRVPINPGSQTFDSDAAIVIHDPMTGTIGYLTVQHGLGILDPQLGGECNPAYPYQSNYAGYYVHPPLASAGYNAAGCSSNQTNSQDYCVIGLNYEWSDLMGEYSGCYYGATNWTDAAVVGIVQEHTLTPNVTTGITSFNDYTLPGPQGNAFKYGGNGAAIGMYDRSGTGAWDTGTEGIGVNIGAYDGPNAEPTLPDYTYDAPTAATMCYSNLYGSRHCTPYWTGGATFQTDVYGAEDLQSSNIIYMINAIQVNFNSPASKGDSGEGVFVADSHGCYWPIGMVFGATVGGNPGYMVDGTNAISYLDYNSIAYQNPPSTNHTLVHSWVPFGGNCPPGEAPLLQGL